ncbi:MAG: leucine-rich repeat domain-containing protein [Dehalococcoidia bacterium]|nr:leucine-rich repeat domain-containing protein [Dehalococcoidia bacterium]
MPYITMEATDDLIAEEYSAADASPATLEEIQSFLKEDRIDRRTFLPNVYDCKHFSADLWRSAYLKGFEASMVLYLRERSESSRNLAKTFYGIENPFHLVVAFLLRDGTWLYIEPQNDKILNIADYKFRLEGAVAFDFWKRLRVFGGDGDETLNEIVEESEKNSREPCAGCGLAEISFTDQNLEAAIREAVGKPTGDIYEADVENLTSFCASERGIVALTGLEHATSLRHLYLDSNNISDISPLANLSSLTDLYLGWNQISDISRLGNLTSLTLLRLDSNQISDISPLANLSSLTNLYLGSNKIGNISRLANLTSLTLLRLDSNQISDISPLAYLSSLTELDLGWNEIGDMSPLGELTSLTDLDLHSNHIGDISALANLTSLTSLRLDSNQISDISSLADLANLTSLRLDSNQISDISALADLANLTSLRLDSNQISDISSLADLTSLTSLRLDSNRISDIFPLVANAGLGEGDKVDLGYNPLSDTSLYTYIPQLQTGGVIVFYEVSAG